MFTRIVPPAGTLISLSDLKSVLRIDHDLDDSILTDMLATATAFVERRLDLAILQQTWEKTLTTLPCGPVDLRPGRVTSIDSVSLTYEDGSTEALGEESWSWVQRLPATILLDVPTVGTGGAVEEVTVTFTSGYAEAASVPPDLLRAILLLTAHYYEEREVFRAERYVPMPLGVSALLEAFREVRI